MKKRLISSILSFAMTASILSGTVLANENTVNDENLTLESASWSDNSWHINEEALENVVFIPSITFRNLSSKSYIDERAMKFGEIALENTKKQFETYIQWKDGTNADGSDTTENEIELIYINDTLTVKVDGSVLELADNLAPEFEGTTTEDMPYEGVGEVSYVKIEFKRTNKATIQHVNLSVKDFSINGIDVEIEDGQLINDTENTVSQEFIIVLPEAVSAEDGVIIKATIDIDGQATGQNIGDHAKVVFTLGKQYDYIAQTTAKEILYLSQSEYEDLDMSTIDSIKDMSTGETIVYTVDALSDIIDEAVDGDIIDLYGSVINESVKLANVLEGKSNITIQNAKFNNAVSITDEINGLTFKNITFTAGDNLDADVGYGAALYLQGDSATKLMQNVVIENCVFQNQDAATSTNAITTSTTGIGNITIKNTTFQDFASVYHNPSVEGSIVYEGNTFENIKNGIMAVGQKNITIKNNTFTNSNGVCIRTNWGNAETCESVNIQNNKFIDVISYAISTKFSSSAVTGFTGKMEISYNYFDDSKTAQEWLTLGEETTYNIYPYYKNEAMTTLVYEGEEEKTVSNAASEALSDVENLTTENSEEIIAATTTIVNLNKEELATNTSVVEKINTLDAVFVDANNNIEVSTSFDNSSVAEEEKIQGVTAPEGLAVAVYGASVPTEYVLLSLGVEQIETSEEVDFAFTAKPYASIDGSEDTPVLNNDIHAPITFNVYLPESFETNYAKVLHIKEDGSEEILTLKVQSDDLGKYIRITVTEFSEFRVTSYAVSSTTTYYKIDATSEGNGTISPNNALLGYISVKKWSNQTFSITADDGYEIEDVLVNGKSVGAVSSYTFTSVTANQSIKAIFVAKELTDEDIDVEDEQENISFDDVNSNDYFYDAVNWAVENEITQGISDTSFGAGKEATREQVMTFLWRLALEPESDVENTFTDVFEEYYYDAILWAVENGITKGIGNDVFGVGKSCTRAQFVTFLWRYAGEEEVSSSIEFEDVAKDDDYSKAIAWAVENEITNGTGDGKFEPNKDCTREQIVTFLYRFAN